MSVGFSFFLRLWTTPGNSKDVGLMFVVNQRLESSKNGFFLVGVSILNSLVYFGLKPFSEKSDPDRFGN